MNDIHNWPLPDKEELFNYLRYNSYRSEQYKLFYVATPKVACTSIKWWFAALEGHSQVLHGITDSIETDHDLVIHETFYKVAPNVTGLTSEDLAVALTSDSYFRFAVVRNPYKRIFSAWQSKLLLQEPLQIGPYLQCDFLHHPIECTDDIAAAFEGFLDHLLANEASSYLDAHWTPQATLLRPDLINYSLLVKIENAQELSQALAKRLGGYIPDPFANRRKNESILPYLPEFVTERSAKLICTLYAEDFETFGYDRQPPKTKETLSTDQFNLVRKAIVLIRGRHQRMGEHNVQKAALNQAIVDYEDQIANHNAKIAYLNQVVSELDGQRMNLNQVVAEQDSQMMILNQDLIDQKNQITSYSQLLAAQDEKIICLNQAVYFSREKLTQILASNSWYITKPIRFLRRLVFNRSYATTMFRLVISKVTHSFWRTLPLAPITKHRLKHYTFSQLPWFFVKFNTYKIWQSSNSVSTIGFDEIVVSSIKQPLLANSRYVSLQGVNNSKQLFILVWHQIRKVKKTLSLMFRVIQLIPYIISCYGSLPNLLRRIQLIRMEEGWGGIQKRTLALLFRKRVNLQLPKGIDNSAILYGDIPLASADFSPKISIIVPNYNHAKYLQERLNSIYNQTYLNYEVILLDDNSTDDSRHILTEYAERNLGNTTCYFNEKNSGTVFSQWKKGIELATGDLIWIAESDDYSSLNFLEEMARGFKNEAIMLAFCRTVFVKGQPLQQAWSSERYLSDLNLNCWDCSWIKSAHWLVNHAWAVKNIIPNVSGALFRHPGKLDLLDNLAWSQLKLCGDWIFYLTIIRGGLVAYSPHTINFYRQHCTNISSDIQKQDIYYQEHEIVAKTILTLYKLSSDILERQAAHLYQHWIQFRGHSSQKEFSTLYDLSRIKKKSLPRKANILMAIYALIAGGGETFPIILANMLKSKGYSMTLFNLGCVKTDSEIRKMIAVGIPVLQVDKPQLTGAIFDDFGIEVVHSHHASVDVHLSSLLSNNMELKQVITMHGMYEMMNRRQLNIYLPLLDERVDQFIYASEKNISGFPLSFRTKKQFVKIDNALPVFGGHSISRSELGIGLSDFVLCLVSRGIPEKGWEEAIAAVTIAQEKSARNIHLLIIGDGPELKRLRLKTNVDYIHFLGFRSNIRDYFAASDIGFIPSKFAGESFPLVLIDCLHAGKPVLASNIGEIAKMLQTENGSAGEVFDLHQWKIPVQDLAVLIVQLAEDGDRYISLLNRVPAAAVKFNPEKMISQYETVYQRLLSDVVSVV